MWVQQFSTANLSLQFSITPIMVNGTVLKTCAPTSKPLSFPKELSVMPLVLPRLPAHCTKKQFGLADGQQLDGDLALITFPVKIEGDDVMVELPSEAEVDAILGTSGLRVQSSCMDISGTELEKDILNGIKSTNSTVAV
mmetsp:Transcript_14456/g.30751  ORF Transcript_14456/g.30751 Transcript_14456/m.30751 type:complete len:139 (+) Transcript_14456:2846-3262(+)